MPQPPPQLLVPLQEQRHRMLGHLRFLAHPNLGGLYHADGLEEKTA
jgi:hypothetical protein